MPLKNAKGKESKPAKSIYAKGLKEQGQNAMRERIKGQQHLNHIVKNIKKLENLKEELNATEVNRLKVATDNHFKILAKILPDVKTIEHTHSGTIEHKEVKELSISLRPLA